jgi:hypothetical protein
VLLHTVSSSGCERNWSTFTLIHTKARNHLLADRFNKLVYISYNMRLRLKHMNNQQHHSDFDPSLYGERNDDDNPIREWVEEQEEYEMELDQPGDPPRPNEEIARELNIDPAEFAQREFAPMHQGRQPSGDDSLERSLSSQPSRRRNRSPTSTSSTSSSSENASSDSAHGGGGGQAIEEEYEDTFVPST